MVLRATLFRAPRLPAAAPRRLLHPTPPTLAGVKSQKPQTGPKTAQRLGIMRNKGMTPATAQTKKAAYAVGDRKALKNRIVLSNTNAPEVRDLLELTGETAVLESALAEVCTLPEGVIDKLRILEAFRREQLWKYFAKAATLVRKESLELGGWMAGIEGAEGGTEGMKGTTKRVLINGRKGAGKSILLLQAQAWALQRGWVLVSIPNAQHLTLGNTAYELDAATSLWTQPDYAAALLDRTARANKPLLSSLTLDTATKIGIIEFAPDTDLHTLCIRGMRDASLAAEIFTVLMHTLSSGSNRPPVLFTLDNFGQISLPSAYRDPDFTVIHAHDLQIPRIFIEYLNGTRAFGAGMVLAATSSNCARTESLDVAMRGEELDVWSKADRRIAGSIAGASVMQVAGVTGDEATALLEYCRCSGLVRSARRLDETEVAARIALSGGLPKELVVGCIRVRG